MRPLVQEDLDHCLALDQRALGGLWSPDQWLRELTEDNRPGLGIWWGAGLRAMACGWLVLDELQITAVAVDPAFRRPPAPGSGTWRARSCTLGSSIRT
jgi:ribosomal-protein-alanine N-acetyltransferase